MLLLPALSLLGCTPQHAEVKGDFFVWLAANSSPVVLEDHLDLSDATRIDCFRGWDADEEDWQDGYIGPREGDDYLDPQFVGGDCADEDQDCLDVIKELQEPCADIAGLELHDFLQKDGFYAFQDSFDIWRSEVVLTSEGGFQLAFHQTLPGGEDFRVIFVIDPDFNPEECVDDGSGAAAVEYVDGSKWRDQWSADVEGDLYYLNAQSIQVNPSDSDEWWFLPSDWSAGFSSAKLSAEVFTSHPTDYGLNVGSETGEAVENFVLGSIADLDYTGPDGEPDGFADAAYNHSSFDPEDDDHVAYHEAMAAEMERRAHGDPDDDSDYGFEGELTQVAGANVDGEPAFEHRVEGNLWRPVDHTAAGLDGWVGVHSSWVRIDPSSEIKDGGEVSGEFQILMDGEESASQILVRGTFKTDRVREDKWGYEYLEDELREANGTPFCDGLTAE